MPKYKSERRRLLEEEAKTARCKDCLNPIISSHSVELLAKLLQVQKCRPCVAQDNQIRALTRRRNTRAYSEQWE